MYLEDSSKNETGSITVETDSLNVFALPYHNLENTEMGHRV